MATIKSYRYSVTIGKGSFKTISSFLNKNRYSSCFILCDENTIRHCLPLLVTSCPALSEAHIIELESGESSKSLEFSAHIWQTLIENKADKNSLLINLGGGVVSDLGGFTASVYKRGIDFINIPTTLLAMADASVGGKTGIDFGSLKNVLGTFTQPKAVFIAPVFLKTLSARHFQNGLAEIFKMALIKDKSLWDLLKNSGAEPAAETLIIQSVALKNEIVLKDPYDTGVRKILNFGHTLGHALESLLLGTEEELLHGEAIVIGMIMESHISYQKKLLSKKDLSEIVSAFQAKFKVDPVKEILVDRIMELIRNDKKNTGSKLKFSLVPKIGTCKYDVDVTEAQVNKAIDYYHSLFK
jgi:3-dehydroquinate synthase